MDPSKTTIILGPPGTGKTTRLLSIVEQELLDWTPANKIGYLAFTRKAAQEARERATKSLSLDPDQLIYFRTLHSMATLLLGIRAESLMQPDHYQQLSKLLGLEISSGQKVDQESGTMRRGDKEGNGYIFLDYLARNTLTDPVKVWSTSDKPGTQQRFDQFVRALKRYKESRHLLDYTDIIETFIRQKPCPRLSCLVIDEGQDLSALQWQMVKVLAEKADRVYIAGDDDQSCYVWAGADVKQFISLEGAIEVLPKSYRLPSRVHRLASRLANKIKSRRSKVWQPREEGGQVDLVQSWEYAGLRQGQWLLLARNHYQLTPLVHYCRDQGYNYATQSGHMASSPVARSIWGYEQLRDGEAVDLETAKSVYDYIDHSLLEKGAKARLAEASPDESYTLEKLQEDYGLWDRLSKLSHSWHTVLIKIKPYDAVYFKKFLARGERLLSEPRIRLSTIHGAKGGEADNVLLLSDMSRQTEESYEQDPDSETRVFYVAVTRAKDRLAIVAPQSARSFSPLLSLL